MRVSADKYKPEEYILRPAQKQDIWAIIKLFYLDFPHLILLVSSSVILLLWIAFFVIYVTTSDSVIKIIFSIYGVGISVPTVFLLNFYFSILSIIKASSFLVIESRQKIVACAIFRSLSNYSEISHLYVVLQDRRKGLGSRLVQAIIRKVNKPIYLIAVPQALYFYTHLRFVPIPINRLPKYYSKASRQGLIVLGFISE